MVLNAAFEWTQPAKHVSCTYETLYNTFLQALFFDFRKTLNIFWNRTFHYFEFQVEYIYFLISYDSVESNTKLYLLWSILKQTIKMKVSIFTKKMFIKFANK